MESSEHSAASSGIAALPASTTRQLGSGQVLVDPSSVVKELIDNALDARAKSIFVDITLNTIDSIQVKDDGHGLASEDRPLACRRYCTSKIRDFHDLKEVGGKWLGFRGEALASLAGMSQTLSVITRVEGEPVAVKLKYGKDGELISSERDSHPVGTTVKATHFLEHLPVRKQTANKNSSKVLAKIRRLMQAYALARPSIRFRLHALKAVNNKSDFIYAPSANANVEDAAFKIVGKTCALQCEWTVTEADGIEVHAFLPKPQVASSKISGPGAFVAVDSRPLANNRGTVKKVVAMFKEHSCRSNSSMLGVKEPFFSMNIICPPDSYDPNVEPAKDDVMFINETAVLDVVRKLLHTFYPSPIENEIEHGPPISAQRLPERAEEDNADLSTSPAGSLRDVTQRGVNHSKWLSSMYGIDEDDLDYLQENQAPVIEDDAGIRDIAVSNPWTIARMNTVKKPQTLASTIQLLSPAKTSITNGARSSSPLTSVEPRSLHMAISMTRPSAAPHRSMAIEQPSVTSLPIRGPSQPNMSDSNNHVVHDDLRSIRTLDHDVNHAQVLPRTTKPHQKPYVNPMPSSKPRQNKKSQWNYHAGMPDNGDEGTGCSRFGQPMADSQLRQSRSSKSKHKELQAPLLFPTEALPPDARSQAGPLTSANNTDIRDFFAERNGHQEVGGSSTNVAGRVAGITYRSPLRSLPDAPLSLPVDDDSASSLMPRGQSKEMSSPRDTKPNTPPTLDGLPSITIQSRLQSRSQAYDMQAHFAGDQAREDNFDSFCNQNIKINDEARQGFIHEDPSRGRLVAKESPRRKASSAALGRRKSSRAPPECMPFGHAMYNVALTVSLNTLFLQREMQKVDAMHNDTAWEISPLKTYNAFMDIFSEEKITTWVQRLDIMLHKHFDKFPSSHISAVLHEGIQKGLAVKKQDANTDTVPPSSHAYTPIAQIADIRRAIVTPVPEVHLLAAHKKVGKWMDDFDMSQFVHLESDAGDDGMYKAEGEHDDMLMGG